MERPTDPREIDRQFREWLTWLSGGVKLHELATPGSLQTTLTAQAVDPCRLTTSTKAKALAKLSEILAPASDEEIADALSSLEQATRPQKGRSDESADERLARYTAKLRHFPADVVLFVCFTWDEQPPPKGSFFPDVAELRSECNALYADRRRYLKAIQALDAAPEPADDAKPSEENVAAVNAIRDRALAALRAAANETERGYTMPAVTSERYILDEARRRAERDSREIERALHGEGEQ